MPQLTDIHGGGQLSSYIDNKQLTVWRNQGRRCTCVIAPTSQCCRRVGLGVSLSRTLSSLCEVQVTYSRVSRVSLRLRLHRFDPRQVQTSPDQGTSLKILHTLVPSRCSIVTCSIPGMPADWGCSDNAGAQSHHCSLWQRF